MITDNLDNIEVCSLGFWWAVVCPAMLLWQEIWSISCRVSPSYSISTTANNHQLGSAPDHLSLGNKEGDNSQWEAFYLNSAASRRISSLRLPQTFLDIFRRKGGCFTFTVRIPAGLWNDFYYLIGLPWPASVTGQGFVSRSPPHFLARLQTGNVKNVSEATDWAIISSGGGSY